MPEVRQARPSKAETVPAKVRTVVYKTIAFLEITYGEYKPDATAARPSATPPRTCFPKAHYDNKVRDLVL